jgi:activator of HSP90 ATPase
MKALKTRTIRQNHVFAAKPADVYNALMSSKIHAKFTGSKASGSARVGGKFTAWDGYITAKNLELIKGEKIVQEWKTSEWPEGYPPSILTLKLKAKGGGAELTMIHSKVPASQADNYDSGWVSSYWDPLRAYFKKE